MANQVIHTENAPAAIGPYSQAVKAGNLLFVSGQVPFVPETMEIVEGDVKAQTAQSLKNLQAILKEAGADFVKTSTGFLTGFDAHGATPEIIKVMQEEVGDKCKVKGSGCIRTREHFLQLIDMGIDRMGVGYRSVPVVLDLKR